MQLGVLTLGRDKPEPTCSFLHDKLTTQFQSGHVWDVGLGLEASGT